MKPSTKATLATLALAAALAGPAVRCKNSDTITGIQSAPPTPTAAFNIAGAWSGTVTGSNPAPSNCRGQMSVTVQVEQSGGSVSFSFPGCPCSTGTSETAFRGTMTAATLSGSLSRTQPYKDSECRMGGAVVGLVESSHVNLKGSLQGRYCNQLDVEIDLRR